MQKTTQGNFCKRPIPTEFLRLVWINSIYNFSPSLVSEPEALATAKFSLVSKNISENTGQPRAVTGLQANRADVSRLRQTPCNSRSRRSRASDSIRCVREHLRASDALERRERYAARRIRSPTASSRACVCLQGNYLLVLHAARRSIGRAR